MHSTIALKPRPVWLPDTRMFSHCPAGPSTVASCGGTTPSLML
jgi:hypothetical protein